VLVIFSPSFIPPTRSRNWNPFIQEHIFMHSSDRVHQQSSLLLFLSIGTTSLPAVFLQLWFSSLSTSTIYGWNLHHLWMIHVVRHVLPLSSPPFSHRSTDAHLLFSFFFSPSTREDDEQCLFSTIPFWSSPIMLMDHSRNIETIGIWMETDTHSELMDQNFIYRLK
jgi:hypothetical protein